MVGRHPQAIALDSKKNLVYVANTQDNTVSVIDPRARSVVATLKAGEHPYAIAVNNDTHKVYVANLSQTAFTVLEPQ
jgi:YVTN family beta-propeller protein